MTAAGVEATPVSGALAHPTNSELCVPGICIPHRSIFLMRCVFRNAAVSRYADAAELKANFYAAGAGICAK